MSIGLSRRDFDLHERLADRSYALLLRADGTFSFMKGALGNQIQFQELPIEGCPKDIIFELKGQILTRVYEEMK